MENYALSINLVGFALIVLGCLGLVVRAFRHWRKGLLPLGFIALGFVVTAFPSAYTRLAPPDLKPRDKMVEGERHVTLTKSNQKDYSYLESQLDTAVLQMANPDVTDATLDHLKKMAQLKELDLSNTQITDAGLLVLKDLPALTSLRLKNTQISDKGFRDTLAGKESLMHLDLTGTQVERETVQTWRSAKPGRRALR